MDACEEVTDAVTREGRLLLLTGERRPLASFDQVFLTGSALRHRMSLLRMHPLMRLDASLVIEPLTTDVTHVREHFLVNRLLVSLHVLRP